MDDFKNIKFTSPGSPSENSESREGAENYGGESSGAYNTASGEGLGEEAMHNNFNSFNRPFNPYEAYAAAQKKHKRKRYLLYAAIAVIVILLSFFTVMLLSGSDDPGYGGGDPYVGTLHIEGTISSSSSSTDSYQQGWILKQIDYMMKDESNKGIMLYVNSPGGGVYPTDEVYLKLEEYKETTGRPLYAYFSETAASGGYYLAAGADKITANRNCTTGSIGVYVGPIMDASGLLEKVGIKAEIIKSSENKAMGNSYQSLTEEQRAIYQSYVDEAYDQFVGIVSEGRGLSDAETRKIADGRVYTAKQALANGLIDEISSFEDAKDAMIKENELEDCKYEKVKYVPETDIFTLLTNIQQSVEEANTKAGRSEAEAALEIIENASKPELMYMMK